MISLKQKRKLTQQIVAVDLFCGIGALTHGLSQAGIEVAAGYDIDESCRFGYEYNNKVPFYAQSVANLQGVDLEQHYPANSLKILVGCAPCQPFSSHTNKIKSKSDQDQRWSLLDSFGKLVEEVRPDFVSMENVPNLKNQDVFCRFVATLENLGYKVNFQIVYCPDYGIPQTRKRLILLASPFAKPRLIDRTHSSDNYIPASEFIEKLPPIAAGEIYQKDKLHRSPNMTEIMLERIRQSKPNGTWLDWDMELRSPCHQNESGSTYKAVYGRMGWDTPAPTITTQFYNFGTGRFGHPDQDRALSLREGALLQTFPSDYKFVETDAEINFTRIGRYIGNAVPVKLGTIIGLSILEHFNRYI